MITSKTVVIPNTKDLTTEYIENKLHELDVHNILRWALVHSSSKYLKINVAYEK
ncbi:hypothetical protein IJG72_02575 [bacterium]|nr:hypothetical protein [bacterium]